MIKKRDLDNVIQTLKAEDVNIKNENSKIVERLTRFDNFQQSMVEDFNSQKRNYDTSFNNLNNELLNLTGDLEHILENLYKSFNRKILMNRLIEELADEIFYTKINENIENFKFYENSKFVEEVYNLNKWIDFKCDEKSDLNNLLKNDNKNIREIYDKDRFKREFKECFNKEKNEIIKQALRKIKF